MKKTFSALLLLSLLLSPAISSAAYLLLLKNGGRLTTPQYWVEGRRIYFFYASGIVGVEKEAIDRIERRAAEIDTDTKVTANADKKDLTSVVSGVEKTPGSPPPAGFEAKPPVSNVSSIAKKENAEKSPDIVQEFNRLEKKFASRKNMTGDELKDLKNDLLGLRSKIVAEHREDEFREMDAKIADMKFFVNDLLIIKSKSD